MKKLTIVLIAVLLASGMISARSLDTKTRRFDMSPNSSKNFQYNLCSNSGVTVSVTSKVSGTSLGSGRIYIEVTNSQGRRVASGTNRVSFNTGRQKGKYKFVFKNKTKKLQKVVASFSWGCSQEGTY